MVTAVANPPILSLGQPYPQAACFAAGCSLSPLRRLGGIERQSDPEGAVGASHLREWHRAGWGCATQTAEERQSPSVLCFPFKGTRPDCDILTELAWPSGE